MEKLKNIINGFNKLNYKVKVRIFAIFFISFLLLFSVISYISTYSDYIIDSSNVTSGVSGNTITVNDFTSDYNYYMSLNYTEVRDRTKLPGADSNGFAMGISQKYTNNNLIKVNINYSGIDANNTNLVGYVSYNEPYVNYKYYKYYYVDNNTVDIELIDNPYTKRPTGHGFNGWVCTGGSNNVCNNSYLTYDDETYTRHLIIKYNNLSNFHIATDTLTINLNAYWVTANIGTITSATTSSSGGIGTIMSNTFQTKGMHSYNNLNYDADDIYVNYWDTVITSYNFKSGTTYYKVVQSIDDSKTKIPSGAYYKRNNETQFRVAGGNTTCNLSSYRPCIVIDTVSGGETFDEDQTYYVYNYSAGTTHEFYTVNTTTNLDQLNTTSANERVSRKVGERVRNASSLSNLTTSSLYYYVTGWHNGDKYYYDQNGKSCTEVACNNGAYKLIQANDSYSNIGSNIQTVTHTENGRSFYYCTVGGASTSTSTSEAGDRAIYSNGQDCSISNLSVDNYYYFATRDTNIAVLGNITSANITSGYTEVNKPYTLTGSYDGSPISSGSVTLNAGSFTLNSDLVIENIKFAGVNLNPTQNNRFSDNFGSNVVTNSIIANGKNLKMGRNITSVNTSYPAVNTIVGTTTSLTNTKFKMIVESGHYNHFRVLSTGKNSNTTLANIDLDVILGNDLDRVNNGNDNLDFQYAVYTRKDGGYVCDTTGCDNSNDVSLNPAVTYLVKSGAYGTAISGYNYTLDEAFCTNCSSYKDFYEYGIFTLGLGNGNNTSLLELIVEGGEIFNIASGPGVKVGNTNVTSAVYVKGGVINTIVGAAGVTVTNSSKIVSVSGGQVTNGVFGGNNGGVKDTGTEGNSQIKTLVYVGGNAKIGYDSADSFNFSNRSQFFLEGNFYGVERGSVYGAGNGSTKKISGNLDSHVIINGGLIKGSVYGGGNYGYVGYDTTKSANTVVDILNGTVSGDVFGAANRNGIGTTSSSKYNIYINMSGGTVSNIYGGSNVRGTVHGKTYIDVTGGTVIDNVYGGGKGNETISNDSVIITVGSSTSSPTIGGVYGGSAYGLVNSNTSGDTSTTATTEVTVNNGTIGKVFGGAEGSSDYTPYVTGDITVTVNGGNVNELYGGFDTAGSPSKTSTVYLKGGNITSAFGGGNRTSQDTTNIYLQGATVGSLYGGCNNSGNVNTSNVTTTSGTASFIYGGNNVGGVTTNANVTINGGVVSDSAFGGGNMTNTNETFIKLQKGNVNKLFGGGNQAGIITQTNVDVTGGSVVDAVYGGSNTSGDVPKTVVNLNSESMPLQLEVSESSVPIQEWEYWTAGSRDYLSVSTFVVTLTNKNDYDVANWSGSIDAPGTKFYHNWSSDTYVSETEDTYVFNSNSRWTSGQVKSIPARTSYSFEVVVFSKTPPTEKTPYTYRLTSRDTSNNVYNSGEAAAKVYGGNNAGGTVTESFVNINNYYASEIYGGNNAGGETITSNVNVNGGQVERIYGGGNNAYTTNPNVYLNDGEIGQVFGGGNQASSKSSNVILKGGTAKDVFGGGNQAGVDVSTNIKTDDAASELNVTNIFGGSNKSGVNPVSNIEITNSEFENVYGGNNEGGNTVITNIDIKNGIVGTVYGGGNNAITGDSTNNTGNTNVNISGGTVTNVFGGGNNATTYITTNVHITGGIISNNVSGGGNNGVVNGDTNVIINNGTINGSAYAGGKGSTATVTGNTNIKVGGTTVIGTPTCEKNIYCSVFAGGDAALTGNEDDNNSTSTVEIAGATIYGNVYGGANTSKVFGNAVVKIGEDAETGDNLSKGIIDIKGNVFGGGEANAEGSEHFTYSFISVNKGIDMYLDATGYDTFIIGGSIFGSGNASSSLGDSHIYLTDYGSSSTIMRNTSIQRATLVVLNNSHLELTGTNDSTDNYHPDRKFSLNRIGHLKLKNNSELYLKSETNVLEKFSSLVDINGEEVKETVTIDDVRKTVTKNVENKLYTYQGINTNIVLDENANQVGDVNGMAFFGMYTYRSDNSINTGMYKTSYRFDDMPDSNEILMFDSGSYVLGKHFDSHDITIDGFYSNFADEETMTTIVIDYIHPTPADATYYKWAIGSPIETQVVYVEASKYSTLGITEFHLMDYYKPNTKVSIVGVNYDGLAPDISLINENQIPRISTNTGTDLADKVMGLAIKSGTEGWITDGTTNFYTVGNVQKDGTQTYLSDNTNTTPSLLFYLYHSKNIQTETTEEDSMGFVTISFVIETPKDELSSKIERLNIEVYLSRILYEDDFYEATITPGKKYDLFPMNVVNITNKSSFSAYFSLFNESQSPIYQDGYHRSIVTDYALPVNTKITMIDSSNRSNPMYYYYVVSESDYLQSIADIANPLKRETTIDLSKFVRMGSNSQYNNYNEQQYNWMYYHWDLHYAEEEFTFIVDFKDSGITDNVLNKKFVLELRDRNNQVKKSVLESKYEQMVFNLYNESAIIELESSTDNINFYNGNNVNLTINTDFISPRTGTGLLINDTTYEDQKLGIKITLYDSDDNILSATDLMGIYYECNGINYYPRYDGTTRINIAERVANVSSRIVIHAEKSNLSGGNYRMVLESFGSADGIYYGLQSSDSVTINFNVTNSKYGLKVTIPDKSRFWDKDTGINLNDNSDLPMHITYESGLSNSNLRIKLYRRTYDDVYSRSYETVDLKDYIINNLTVADSAKKEYYIVRPAITNLDFTLSLKDNLVSGTYKVEVSLYDNNTLVGSVYQYIIIK